MYNIKQNENAQTFRNEKCSWKLICSSSNKFQCSIETDTMAETVAVTAAETSIKKEGQCSKS